MQVVRKSVAVLTTAVAVLGWTAVAVPAATAASAPSRPRVVGAAGLRPGMMPTSAQQAAHASAPRRFAVATPHLSYYGGPVVSNAQVASVLWGPGSGSSTGVGSYRPEVTGAASPDMGSFFGGALRSPHLAWLKEYNANNQAIGLGSYAGRTTISPAATGTTVFDSDIQSELVNDVTSHVLPTPTVDASGNPNTIYAVFFPAGITIDDGSGNTSGTVFCAYHGATSATVGGVHLLYAVLPDDSVDNGGMHSGCGAGTDFQNLMSYTSHEIVETITDPLVSIASAPLSWYDATYGEIGDICNQDEQPVTGSDGVTYTVQSEWSNALAACIAQKAGALDHLSVTPTPSSIAAGAASPTMVEGFDVSGNSLGDLTPQSVLSIAPDGSCSATSCTATHAGSHTVTATDGAKTASAALSVVPAAVDHLVVTGSPATVEMGSPASFSVAGFDAYGNGLGDVTGASALTISPDGSCAVGSCTPAALGVHTVTASYGGKTATGSLTAVDTHAPTATLTRPTAAQVLGSSAVVSWTGADSGSGVATYQVRYQRAPWNGRFGAWSYPTAWQALTTTSLTATGLARGYDYCYSARAIDRVGNLSPWTAARCIAVPLDDRALSPSTGWTRASSTRFWNSTATGTTRRGASLVRTGARFTRVGVVATRCATCGVVAVYSGSTYLGRLNLAASRTSYRSVLMLPRVSLRSATVTLRVLSTGKLVQVDGLVLLPT